LDDMLHRDFARKGRSAVGVQVASFYQLYNYMSMEMHKCSKK